MFVYFFAPFRKQSDEISPEGLLFDISRLSDRRNEPDGKRTQISDRTFALRDMVCFYSFTQAVRNWDEDFFPALNASVDHIHDHAADYTGTAVQVSFELGDKLGTKRPVTVYILAPKTAIEHEMEVVKALLDDDSNKGDWNKKYPFMTNRVDQVSYLKIGAKELARSGGKVTSSAPAGEMDLKNHAMIFLDRELYEKTAQHFGIAIPPVERAATR